METFTFTETMVEKVWFENSILKTISNKLSKEKKREKLTMQDSLPTYIWKSELSANQCSPTLDCTANLQLPMRQGSVANIMNSSYFFTSHALVAIPVYVRRLPRNGLIRFGLKYPQARSSCVKFTLNVTLKQCPTTEPVNDLNEWIYINRT